MTSTHLHHQFDDLEQQRHAVHLGMWLFLASEVLLFSVLFTAYAAARHLFPDAFAETGHHLYKWLGVTNAAVLLLSSAAMAMAVELPPAMSRPKSAWLGATVCLGIVFLIIKAIEYTLDYREGLVPAIRFDTSAFSDPTHSAMFLTFYWIMTALHALHVSGGIGFIAYLGIRSCRSKDPVRLDNTIHAAGLYWHFVDIVWLILLPLLYLNP